MANDLPMSATPAVATGSPMLVSRRDLRFLLHEWLQVGRLCDRERDAEPSPELFDDVLELAERIAADRFAPHNRAADEAEPHIGADGKVKLVDGVGEALAAFFVRGLGRARL